MNRYIIAMCLLCPAAFMAGVMVSSASAQDEKTIEPKSECPACECPVCQECPTCPEAPPCQPSKPEPTPEQLAAVRKAMEAIQAAEDQKTDEPADPVKNQ